MQLTVNGEPFASLVIHLLALAVVTVALPSTEDEFDPPGFKTGLIKNETGM